MKQLIQAILVDQHTRDTAALRDLALEQAGDEFWPWE